MHARSGMHQGCSVQLSYHERQRAVSIADLHIGCHAASDTKNTTYSCVMQLMQTLAAEHARKKGIVQVHNKGGAPLICKTGPNVHSQVAHLTQDI